jgi:hypothetical protein
VRVWIGLHAGNLIQRADFAKTEEAGRRQYAKGGAVIVRSAPDQKAATANFQTVLIEEAMPSPAD